VLGMQRQRIAADYLQTSAIIAPDGTVEAAVNDPNEYAGPGTGYRLEGDRWARLCSLPHELDPRALADGGTDGRPPLLAELAQAGRGDSAREVVVAVGPAFGDGLRETINGLRHEEVLAAVVAGVREGGAEPRLVRVRRSSDVAFIAHDGARLSGSGVGVGLQSKGTAVIHRADLQPLDNLELFGMAPLLTLASYRAIGRNAAGYAFGEPVGPVPTELDNFARAKLIVTTTLLHARETAAIVPNAPAIDVTLA
jgi:propanediol dehydratase large subunit